MQREFTHTHTKTQNPRTYLHIYSQRTIYMNALCVHRPFLHFHCRKYFSLSTLAAKKVKCQCIASGAIESFSRAFALASWVTVYTCPYNCLDTYTYTYIHKIRFVCEGIRDFPLLCKGISMKLLYAMFTCVCVCQRQCL